MEILKTLAADCTVLSVVHLGLLLLLAYALFRTKKKAKPITNTVSISSTEDDHREPVVRTFTSFPAEVVQTLGQEGWAAFPLVYGFLSVLLLQVVSVAEVAKGYKVPITIIDLGIALYLCFFSYWFRQKILSLVNVTREL